MPGEQRYVVIPQEDEVVSYDIYDFDDFAEAIDYAKFLVRARFNIEIELAESKKDRKLADVYKSELAIALDEVDSRNGAEFGSWQVDIRPLDRFDPSYLTSPE